MTLSSLSTATIKENLGVCVVTDGEQRRVSCGDAGRTSLIPNFSLIPNLSLIVAEGAEGAEGGQGRERRCQGVPKRPSWATSSTARRPRRSEGERRSGAA